MENGRTEVRKKDLRIDLRCYTVTLAENEIHLSVKEFKLIRLLAQHPNWVFSKEEIYANVYGEENSIDISNMIFCLIHSLRKKLEPNPQQPKYIKTVRGFGYKFVIPEE